MEYPIKVKYDPERKSWVADSIVRYAVQTSKTILRVLLDYRSLVPSLRLVYLPCR